MDGGWGYGIVFEIWVGRRGRYKGGTGLEMGAIPFCQL